MSLTPFYANYPKEGAVKTESMCLLERRVWDAMAGVPLDSIADPHQLTDEQKFSVAVAAGVRIESSSYVDGKLTLTTEPCGVVHDGRGFQVYVKAKRQC